MVKKVSFLSHTRGLTAAASRLQGMQLAGCLAHRGGLSAAAQQVSLLLITSHKLEVPMTPSNSRCQLQVQVVTSNSD